MPQLIPARASSVKHQIAQAAHGFAVGNAISLSGGAYVLAQADDAGTLAWGIVSRVETNAFEYVAYGVLDWPAHGLTLDTDYYLDPAVAGGLTATRPTGLTEFIQMLVIATDANTVRVFDYAALGVGGAISARGIQIYTAGTDYEVNDLFEYDSGIYKVVTAFTNAPATPPWTSLAVAGGTKHHAVTTGGGVTAGDVVYEELDYGQVVLGEMLALGPVSGRASIISKDNTFLDFDQEHGTANAGMNFRFMRNSDVGTGPCSSVWYKADASGDQAMHLNHQTGYLTVYGKILSKTNFSGMSTVNSSFQDMDGIRDDGVTNFDFNYRYGRGSNTGTGACNSSWYAGDGTSTQAMSLNHKTGILTVAAGIQVDSGTIALFNQSHATPRVFIVDGNGTMTHQGNLNTVGNARFHEDLHMQDGKDLCARGPLSDGNTFDDCRWIWRSNDPVLASYHLYRVTSSSCYKENIRELGVELSLSFTDAVSALRPVMFDPLRDTPDRCSKESSGSDAIGFIAEEVAAVHPSLSVIDLKTGNPSNINPSALIALLAGAVKELTARVEELEAKVP